MSNPVTETSSGAPGSDTLAALHRMSRTAGLGSTEYVAVNSLAVTALMLGVASFLAVLGTFLLIIPAIAVLLAIVSIRQVWRSAGTQTGTGIAILGMLLAFACVGLIGGREALHARQVGAEREQIANLLSSFGSDLSKADYDAAWSAFGPRFQERVKRTDFDNLWKTIQASRYYGPITAVRSNGIVDVEIDPASGAMLGRGVAIFDHTLNGATAEDRRESIFHKTDQGWRIEDIQGWFEEPNTKPAGAGNSRALAPSRGG